ncbi:MBL fold metallo-hydrolase [Corynebacterium macclintockiae]|uniref:MBL fold metallo-hydrolase n=1 Tax=Corynebacterium macclintockiae TaxID=2913501 RepID=UPI000550B144
MSTESAPSPVDLPESTQILSFPAGPFETNCYVVIDGSDATSGENSPAVVIDPGLGAFAHIQRLAEENKFFVEKVVLTHGHIDHIRDAGAFGVPVYVHELDRFMLEMDQTASPLAQPFDVANMPKIEDIRPLGDSISIGGAEFEIHHMPGHSPGHVMFRVNGLIFGGDVLFRGGVGRTDLPGCSPEDMMLSLKKLTTDFSDGDIVLPGHGPHTTIGEEKRTNSFLAAVK